MTRSRDTAEVYSEGTLLDVANTQLGTAAFASDVYTFTSLSGEYPTLQTGMVISFKLPAGSVNTTTTSTIDYNGTEYTIKWIDSSALEASDLDVTYNKQIISFYFDGTDMLIASDISGSNSDGDWYKYASGVLVNSASFSDTIASNTGSSLGGFFGDGANITYAKNFSAVPDLSTTYTSNAISLGTASSPTTSGFTPRYRTISSSASSSRAGSYLATGRWY